MIDINFSRWPIIISAMLLSLSPGPSPTGHHHLTSLNCISKKLWIPLVQEYFKGEDMIRDFIWLHPLAQASVSY